MANLDTILDRIVAIADDLSGVTLAGKNYPDDNTFETSLPFCFVTEDNAGYEKLNSSMWEVEREYLLLLYVSMINPEDGTTENAARDLCRPFLVSFPTQFLQRTRLQRNDNGPDDVKHAFLRRDEGIQTASRNGKVYAGIAFRLTVTYELQISEV